MDIAGWPREALRAAGAWSPLDLIHCYYLIDSRMAFVKTLCEEPWSPGVRQSLWALTCPRCLARLRGDNDWRERVF